MAGEVYKRGGATRRHTARFHSQMERLRCESVLVPGAQARGTRGQDVVQQIQDVSLRKGGSWRSRQRGTGKKRSGWHDIGCAGAISVWKAARRISRVSSDAFKHVCLDPTTSRPEHADWRSKVLVSRGCWNRHHDPDAIPPV